MRTSQVLDLLRTFESRNVTAIEPDGSWPIVWERARGVNVWDAEEKKYVDLTAAFGVAAAGHANPRVVRAGQRQMARLLHAMGDVHPHAGKAELARELSRITFERWTEQASPKSKVQSPKFPERGREFQPAFSRITHHASPLTHHASRITHHAPHSPTAGKTLFGNSGFEAVEAALKTAMLVTGKRGVIAFTGAYHGLGYGALNATHRHLFRAPFLQQLGGFSHFVPFPDSDVADLGFLEREIRRVLRRGRMGAILVEPVQGRGGIRVPPPSFLPLLRQLCDQHDVLLVLDEVYTGFGRTGKWFACEHSQTIPDIICLGKALAGGFPLSACVGRADLMDAAWPASEGEAIHTSTFLGHPVGCAMSLAQIEEIQKKHLVERSARLGRFLLKSLSDLPHCSRLRCSARGLGLMAGLELTSPSGSPATAKAFHVIKSMLRRGFILLPEGEHSNVIGFTPPLTITKALLARTIEELAGLLK